MSRLDSRARRLLELRDENDRAQREAKAAKAALDDYEMEFWSELEDLGLKSVSLELGPPYGSVRLERRERRDSRVLDLRSLTEWVIAEGYAAELLRDEPRKAVLNQFVRTRTENGQPLPPGLDFTTKRYVSVTKKKR